MTTDKPEVIAWEVRTLSDPKEQFGTSPSYPEWAEGDADLIITPLVSLSDYEALQAECEELRKDGERLDFLEDKAKMSFPGVVLDFVKYVFGKRTVESGFRLIASGIAVEPKDTLRLAIDDAMQELKS